MAVNVRTDGDNFTEIKCERAMVELHKDWFSPARQNSWTYGVWFDGEPVAGMVDEASLDEVVKDAMKGLTEAIDELSAVRDFLTSYGALCREPEVR